MCFMNRVLTPYLALSLLINPPMKQYMLDNGLKDEEDTCSNRHVVLQKDSDNNMVRACMQQGSLK